MTKPTTEARKLCCPNCDGGLDGHDLAYGLVCPVCGIRVAGPFANGADVPDYVSLAYNVEGQKESHLVALMSGRRKLSDRAIRTALRCTQGELITLAERVRAQLGLAAGHDLRSFLLSGNRTW